mgnify:CR=1 FL=1
MTTTVGDILTRARAILQEVTNEGVRWTNAELLDWLNEAYATILNAYPSAYTVTAEFQCVKGTRQFLPDGAERLVDVIRNINGAIVTKASREAMNLSRRTWHSEPETETIENYIFDELSPRSFYVYPPASLDAKLEIMYSKVPSHDIFMQAYPDSVEPIMLQDTYAPIILDLILSRAFLKDAEGQANAQRAQLHGSSASSALTLKIQGIEASNPMKVQK